MGLMKPSLFEKVVGQAKATRKVLSLGFGAVIVIALVILATHAPKTPVKQAATQRSAPTTQTTQTATTTPAATPDTTTQTQPVTTPAPTPTLRQDLAFQGDPTYCDGHYRANDNGTTTWTLDIKYKGEIITHLSDNSGHIYRHDDKVNAGEYSYTAAVDISNVAEINGVLYVGNDSHPCNISPQS